MQVLEIRVREPNRSEYDYKRPGWNGSFIYLIYDCFRIFDIASRTVLNTILKNKYSNSIRNSKYLYVLVFIILYGTIHGQKFNQW